MSHIIHERFVYLFVLLIASFSTVVRSYPPTRAGYSIFKPTTMFAGCDYDTKHNVTTWQRVLPTDEVASNATSSALDFRYLAHGLVKEDPLQDFRDYDAMVASLRQWLSPGNQYIRPYRASPDCFSTSQICEPRYYCVINSLKSKCGSYFDCLEQKFNITREEERSSDWRCEVVLEKTVYLEDCQDPQWNLTPQNWNDSNTDYNLQRAVQDDVDEEGDCWEGRSGNATLAESFGRKFWNVFLKCTLANPCQDVPACNSVGLFNANPLGQSKPVPTPWVFFATSAFVNINQQLRNQYNELKDAIESLALDTFSIDDFFPTKSQDFSLLNSLTGLSGIFSILGGFVPVAGPFIGAAGTIASGVGTFLQNSAAPPDSFEAQKIFSQKVLTFYRASLSAMEDLVAKLFIGEPIPAPGPGSFTLLDMMKGGAWVNSNSLTNVSRLNDDDQKRDSSPINRFAMEIADERADDQDIVPFSTGPPDSKYCADGGVYYTYNFWEQKSEGGGVGWPYGADKLKSSAGIELKWVTEASAKSYRTMKDVGQDPFKFNQTNGTMQFLATAFTAHPDPSEYAGRFPGSWTLPVCDASTWGKKWNWDYTGKKNDIRESVDTHPPCLCGPKGLETYDWAKAAGLSGFETFWHRCDFALTDKSLNFEWPDGVTFVNYPADTGNKDFTVKKP